MINAQVLIDELDNAGFTAEPYSGRCMFGKQCVGVAVEGDEYLWRLAYALGEAGFDPGAPRTDSLALDIIAYWPAAEWPA